MCDGACGGEALQMIWMGLAILHTVMIGGTSVTLCTHCQHYVHIVSTIVHIISTTEHH